ncbi:MAG: DUF1273 family protein [Ruminococcus sp.]|nr:DUF1273 family protein [Ruminococcus sp.]
MLRSLSSGRTITAPEQFVPVPEKTVCITGHREKYIQPYAGDPDMFGQTVCCVRMLLGRYIDLAYEAGCTFFMDGLALGTDLWAASHILRRKKEGWDIHLIGVMPFLHHADYFPEREKAFLAEAERFCDSLICTESDPGTVYTRQGSGSTLYRRRNCFMADCSSTGIAFLNSDARRSGTGQTVAYLRSQGKPAAVFGCDEVHRLMKLSGGGKAEFSRYIADIPDPFSPAQPFLPGFA